MNTTMNTPMTSPSLPLLGKNTLRNAGYAAVVIVILTLTGIFGSFAGRSVLGDDLSLSTVLLLGTLLGVGYLTASAVRENGIPALIVNGVVGALVVGAALALVVLFTTAVDTRFVFQNIGSLAGSPIVFGIADLVTGILVLLGASVGMGVLAAFVVLLSARIREVIVISLALTLVLGILQDQFNQVMALPDAVLMLAVFAAAYSAVISTQAAQPIPIRAGIGAGVSVVIGIVLALVFGGLGLAVAGWAGVNSKAPLILSQWQNGNFLLYALVMIATGAVAGLVVRSTRGIHESAWSFLTGLIVLGILNWQGEMSLLAAAFVFGVVAFSQALLPTISTQAHTRFEQNSRTEQRQTQLLMFAALFGVLIFVPQFAGLSISNTINLTALYITMGIGLSVMVGYAGLLDLGYAAAFAIGAYTVGLLTTPSLLTCGGIAPEEVLDAGRTITETCTGVMTFWQALPFAIIASSLIRILLGIPVLRLRGDYLAIVTLGFGEIIQILVKSNALKPLFGGAQGIIQVPLPQIFGTTLTNSTEVYYVYMFGMMFAAFMLMRLANTRLGRAWRAMRDDEDVAEAMGINLVSTKLLAFGVSSAFAGLAGAIFGSTFQSIFPDSFTLLVSINVLSLIIIGGMGSIQGVILGAFVLRGLPELMRELQDYRLLAFGALLVMVMILKPEGLLPPQPPKLAEEVSEGRAARPQPQGAD